MQGKGSGGTVEGREDAWRGKGSGRGKGGALGTEAPG